MNITDFLEWLDKERINDQEIPRAGRLDDLITTLRMLNEFIDE